MSEELFSVWQWFPDGTYERVGERLSAREAVELAHSYVHRPAALAGIIVKVQITDSGDHTVFLWDAAHGQGAAGIVFPPRGGKGGAS